MSIKVYLSIVIYFTLFLVSCKNSDTNSTQNSDVNFQDQNLGVAKIDNLTTQLSRDPDNVELLFDRSVAYREIKAYDNSIADMEKLLSIGPDQPKYYTHLSEVFMDYSRSKQAFQTLQIASEKFPQNVNILLKFAELSITLKQNQKAVQTIQKILEQDNQNAQAYFLMGILMQSEGDLERAKAALKNVVQIDPEIIDAYLLLGELYEKEDPKLAKQYLTNALTIAPDDINSLHSMAFFKQNNNDVPGALEIYSRINNLDPTYTPAFLNSGILFLEKENYERALEQFNIMVGIDPSSYLAYFYRGYAKMLMGKKIEAKADFENALRINPDYEKALNQMTELKRQGIE